MTLLVICTDNIHSIYMGNVISEGYNWSLCSVSQASCGLFTRYTPAKEKTHFDLSDNIHTIVLLVLLRYVPFIWAIELLQGSFMVYWVIK